MQDKIKEACRRDPRLHAAPPVSTHEIIVLGPESRLTIPVMLDQGDLWQRSEHQRRVPFPMWRLFDGKLEYRHGDMPAGATIEEIVMCLQCRLPLHYDDQLTFIDNSNPGLGGCHLRCVDAYLPARSRPEQGRRRR